MAVSSSFKQKCPSCEAMVTIRDPGLVGKKVECSKCKYRFVVESPVAQDKAGSKGNGNGKNGHGPQVKAGPAKADGKKRFEDDDLETKGKAKAKAKAAPKKRARDDDEDDEDDDAGKKKGSGTPIKLLIGLLLGFVGLGVLGVCAWLIISMNRGPAPANNPPGTSPPMAGPTPGMPPPGGDPAAPGSPTTPGTPADASKGNEGKKETKPAAPTVAAVKGPGPEVTNLLPGETEHVFHLFMKDLFEPGGSLRDAVFQEPGSLAGVNFKKRLGFDLEQIADLIRAERYSAPAWSMTTLFLSEPINEAAVVSALGLKQAAPIKGKAYYKAERPNPTFEQLARFSFGVPQNVRLATAKADRPLFVRFHTPQTLIVSDEEPLVALLKANGHFPEQTPRPTPTPPAETQPPAPGTTPPGAPPGMMPPGSPMVPPGSPPPIFPPGATPSGMPPSNPPPVFPPGATPSGMPPGMPPGAPTMPPSPKGAMSVSPAAPDLALADRGRLELPAGAERVGFFTLPGSAAPALSGQFGPRRPPVLPPGFQKPGAGSTLAGTSWSGSETLANYGSLRFDFHNGGRVVMHDADGATNGRYVQNGGSVTLNFPGGVTYQGTINGATMSGNATNATGANWTWNVSQGGAGATPVGAPMPTQGTPPPTLNPPGTPPGMPPGTIPPQPPPGTPPGMPPTPPPGMSPGTPPTTLNPPGTTPGMPPGTSPGMPPTPSGMPPGTAPGIPPTPSGMPPGTPSGMPPPIFPPGATPSGMPPGTNPTPGAPPPPAPGGNPRDEMYLTIKPRLKAMLDKMEVAAAGTKDRVLFSAVTDLEAARITTAAPEFKNQVIRVPRELWDITYLLDEPRPGLRLLGAALIQKDNRSFQLKNELHCNQDLDAKEFHKQLQDKGCPQLARFFEKLFEHKVELPKEEKDPSAEVPGTGPPTLSPPGTPPGYPMPPGMKPPTGPPPGYPMPQGTPPGMPPGMKPPGYPMPQGTPPGAFPPGAKQPGAEPAPKEEATASRITLSRDEKTIAFALDLVMDKGTFDRVLGVATLTAGMLRVDIDLANVPLRHDLAKALKQTAEKGLTDAGVPAGQYPPGAFAPLELKTRQAQEPKNRISWMAGLLPFMGQEALHARISFRHNWRDPANWIAGRAVVPEFLDPMYPDATRQVLVGGVPTEFGATHFVGVAGVGLDAASYPRDDPAYVAKRGIFGYDKSATLQEVQAGRGLSNAIAVLQVPHDGPAGVTPWIAGGGATLRGVPEKNAIAPFVLSTDRYGKVIQHNGKRGTYAMMADGAVRFIDQNVSDEVFKAMCTVGGGGPDNFSPKTDPHTPLVPAPRKDDAKPEPPTAARPPVKPAAPPAPAKSADAAVPSGWVTFQGDGFSVAMPQQPQAQTVDVPGFGKVTVHTAPLAAQKAELSAASVKLPEPALAQIKALGDAGLKQLVLMGAKQGVKVVRETPVTQGAHSGREYVLEVDLPQAGKLTSTTRVFIVNDRVISLDVNGAGPPPAEAAAFFNSLKIGG